MAVPATPVAGVALPLEREEGEDFWALSLPRVLNVGECLASSVAFVAAGAAGAPASRASAVG